MSRNSNWRFSIKKAVFKNFTIFTEKFFCWSLFLKKLFQDRCSAVNITKFLRTFISKNIYEWLLLKCGLQQQWGATFPGKTGWNRVRYSYILYLFVLFWYYCICILSKSVHAEVFYKKLFLKILQNLQENNRVGVMVSIVSEATVFYLLQRHIWNLVEDLRWSCFAKIVNG